ncbi:MAG: EAL domain-containing protein, partial [Desulfuromonadales bacterium]|nr:EAL domain-containing protein [Desulfuromonadales bacterium]
PEAKERIVFYTENGRNFFHYCTPLLVESYCFNCHEQGENSPSQNPSVFNYQIGDIHGVMSIKFSADTLRTRIVHAMKANSLLHSAGFLLTFLTISLLLKVAVINKLACLKKAAMRLSDGELSVRAAISGSDEIAKVSAAFDSMAAAISERTELLGKSQASLANAQRIAKLGNWDWDIVNKRLYWSDETYRIFGLRPQEFEPSFKAFLGMVSPEDRESLERAVQGALQGEGGYSMEYRLVLPDNAIRYVYEQGEVTFDNMGSPVNLVGTVYDITERKRTEKAVVAKHAFLQTVIDGVVEPIMVIDLNYKTVMMNRAANPYWPDQPLVEEEYCCYQISHHSDKPCSGKDHPCPLEEIRKTGKPTTVVHEHLIGSGEIRTYELQASPLWNEDGTLQGIIEASRDITDRVHAEARLRENERRLNLLAHHDTLTNLPNRLLFHDRLHQAMIKAHRTNQQVALLFLDLDRFKNINDSLGHAIGDRVLLEVSRRLSSGIRESDTVARLGGDEFVIIMEQIQDVTGVAAVAQKILRALSQVLGVEGHELFVTASIGISLYPSDGVDIESLMKYADVAMYRAKEQGRNNYQFYKPEMNARTHELLLLEGKLRQALDLKQLLLHYQPQIDLDSGRLIGMEALLRWKHPKEGLIHPSDFIPLAEETGLIIPIGEWVLHNACVQNKAWQKSGHPPIVVAVNISALQLHQPDFIDMVERVLKETGLDPEWLELEFTESAAMGNVEEIIKTLTDLKGRGIQLAIDDFGTGHSSLSYLKRFPITKLKIDQSFVSDITTDINDAAIVASIIAIARTMNIGVIAEGVETKEQLRFLLEKGCEQCQGFLFSRPLPAGKLEHFFIRGDDKKTRKGEWWMK